MVTDYVGGVILWMEVILHHLIIHLDLYPPNYLIHLNLYTKNKAVFGIWDPDPCKISSIHCIVGLQDFFQLLPAGSYPQPYAQKPLAPKPNPSKSVSL